jgi:hypothetical protein
MTFSRPALCLTVVSATALLLIPAGAAERPAAAPSPNVVAPGGAPAPKVVVPAAALRLAFVSKGKIEAAPEALLAASAAPKADAFVNPKVAPGKVSWHPSFQSACAASKASGKPVMLFQLLGKLDDQFC